MGSTFLTSCMLLVIGLTATICSADDVPVFVWGDLEYKSQSANPLERTAPAEFVSTLRSELKTNPLLIVFIEETLSVEDFSSRDESGSSLLPYLRSQLKDSFYLPAVRDPVDSVSIIAGEEKVERARLTTEGLSSPISKQATVVMVELSDASADESRAALLRRHDEFMRRTVAELSERADVVAVYTARAPSWTGGDSETHRSRREAQLVSASNVEVYNLTKLIIAFSQVQVTKGTEKTDIKLSTPVVESNEKAMNISISDTTYTITLQMTSAGGYWMIKSALLKPTIGDEVQLSASDAYAHGDFSFHCGRFRLASATHIVTFADFQIQPFFQGNPHMFGDAYDCVGFFSVPIWSGIFVLTIILAIFFYGVISMMDIRTMDRFDDAKGKTITINTSE